MGSCQKCDIALIYGAFRSVYGIDLMTAHDLHWWTFSALFDALPPETEIKSLIRLRAQDLGKKAAREQKAAKERLALPAEVRYYSDKDKRVSRKYETPEQTAERFARRLAAVKKETP